MEESKSTKNRPVISISSSSSSSFSSEEDYLEESEFESEDSDSSSEFCAEDISSSTCDDEAENDDCGYGKEKGKDGDSMSRRVVHLLNGRSDLEEITLVECKAYLRRNGLRLSGTRADCIQRIKEHWRIKDGRGQIHYPRSSFTIDCTGDVCRGDVVLFTQKVYKKFDKITRSGSLLGKRTVAGRVVKESYGAAKQQHTFTVEVFWSKGVKELPPLFPLLVKGRNLYRLKTLRQSWKNEKERLKVLDEKHKRGAAARQIREIRKARSVKRTRKKSLTKEVSKHQKRFHHSSSPEMSQVATSKQESHPGGQGKASTWRQGSKFSSQKAPPPGQSSFQGKSKSSIPASQRRHKNLIHKPDIGGSSVQPDVYPQNLSIFQSKQYHQEATCLFSSECGSTSTQNWLPFASHSNPFFMPSSGREEIVNHDIRSNYGCLTSLARERDGNNFSGPRGTFWSSSYTSRGRR